MPQRPGDPFTDLGLLQREVNTLFERLLSSERGEGADGQWSPPVDVYECRGKLLVVVEVAGIGPDSLRVVHRNGDIVVSGERRERRSRSKNIVYHCVERPGGRFARRIPLDGPLDVAAAEAVLAGGLLTITLPRLPERRGRETEIAVRREEP